MYRYLLIVVLFFTFTYAAEAQRVINWQQPARGQGSMPDAVPQAVSEQTASQMSKEMKVSSKPSETYPRCRNR